MSGRWANLALAVLVPLATLSGIGLFLVGSGPVWLVGVLHGGLSLGLLALVPWKRPAVQRGLRRLGRAGREVSIALTWLVLAALLTGLAHLVGLTAGDLPVTTIQLHVTLGVVATVLTVAHVVQRPVRVRRTDWGRRSLLRAGAVVASAGGLGAAAAGVATALDRSSRRRPTGSFEVGAEAGSVPVTQWFLDGVPSIDAADWRLTVVSLEGAHEWSLADLDRRDEVTAVLDCTGGWWAEQTWSGMRLSRLLPHVDPGGTVLVTSTTGYARRLPLSDDLLLATTMAGAPLSPGHGAPVRLVVPGRRGYHWVKWVVRVEVVSGPWWAQPPLPLR
ncbi:MAG: molybdopterin-dependent oxidoreductase [Lapillicoccus sp.]